MGEQTGNRRRSEGLLASTHRSSDGLKGAAPIRRRHFLKSLGVLLPLTGPICSSVASGEFSRLDYSGNVFLAPDAPEEWPAFRGRLAEWRAQARARLNYNDELYQKKELSWSAANYCCCFVMLYDETFYDRSKGRFDAPSVLRHGEIEFGGYDSVVLWHAYPRIGVDDRNQFDFYRDMPGGLNGLRAAVREFHQQGVKVYIDYNPWDAGTRRESKCDSEILVEIIGALEADGVFLDTMERMAKDLRKNLDEQRRGVILESEGAVPLENIHNHHGSWAQGFGDSYAPGVLKHKWFEPRHMQHQIRRWDEDHTAELHAAWMNGSGIMVWENVFGSWMPWSGRDRSIARSMLPIQRRYTRLFSGGSWTPLVPIEQPGVFGSLWEQHGLKLWTLVNRTEKAIEGTLLRVPCEPGDLHFDLVTGTPARQEAQPGRVLLSGNIPPRHIGCFVTGPASHFGADFDRFLQHQHQVNCGGASDATSSVTGPAVRTQWIKPPPGVIVRDVPAGMVEIPAARIELQIEMRVRECGFYESHPPRGHHLGDSYAFRVERFQRSVQFNRFAMDQRLVTNAQFARFLRDTGYTPRFQANFLKHWHDKNPPPGKEDHPVVYVDLDDARAFARWCGKRLPLEEEWQYAGQGPDGRKFPWGDTLEPDRCNAGKTGTTTPVGAFPLGRSPFGCDDMCGNVWQWTESERSDGHTRFCILRGGSFFAAQGSNWYVDGGPRPVNFATKFLMLWPGLDRCSTVGFRCVTDLV